MAVMWVDVLYFLQDQLAEARRVAAREAVAAEEAKAAVAEEEK